MVCSKSVHGATWRSGYATVCKTVYTSSILVVASTLNLWRFRQIGTATGRAARRFWPFQRVRFPPGLSGADQRRPAANPNFAMSISMASPPVELGEDTWGEGSSAAK